MSENTSSSPWQALASLRRCLTAFWDAILIVSLSMVAASYTASLSLHAQSLIHLFLVLAALAVVFRRCLPAIRANMHLFLARLGRRPTRASPHYVKALFDDYSDEFERHLMIDLSYRAPNLLIGIVAERTLPSAPVILDVGCGTGICGPLFKPIAGTLIGVDLSPKMLALAAQKQCYDRLVEADFVDVLRQQRGTIDLCIGSDVLVYLGDLDTLFSDVWQALRPSGFFAFTVETTSGNGWSLQKNGRYAHSSSYIHECARSAGFAIVEWRYAVLRTQGGAPVCGNVWLLQRAPDDGPHASPSTVGRGGWGAKHDVD